jgi:hypothetical protein
MVPTLLNPHTQQERRLNGSHEYRRVEIEMHGEFYELQIRIRGKRSVLLLVEAWHDLSRRVQRNWKKALADAVEGEGCWRMIHHGLQPIMVSPLWTSVRCGLLRDRRQSTIGYCFAEPCEITHVKEGYETDVLINQQHDSHFIVNHGICQPMSIVSSSPWYSSVDYTPW